MNDSIKVDYIIVGQGLAGSAVAVQLLRLGKKILVIDQPEKNVSTVIAAGLFNPVTGKKMVKTWMADELFTYLDTFYREAEGLTGGSFFHPMPLYRPFVSVEEQNEWMARSADPSYGDYIDQILMKPSYAEVNDVYGGLLLKQCGYLDTIHYMDSVRKCVEQNGYYRNEDLDFTQLTLKEDGIGYRHYRSEKIVFCHGTHNNPFFQWLPIRPSKGETLTLQSDTTSSMIMNRGVYVVPLKGNQWRVGATYNFHDQEPGITESSRRELIEKVNDLCQFPYSVANQQWGIRPTTIDRKPMLGEHPELKSVYIFNGLGTKGVSLAPYFSDVLIRLTEKQVPVNKEVDIARYKSLYSNSSL